MSKIILLEEFEEYWKEESVFDRVQAIEGTIAKAKDNRRVLRFELNGRAYYLKHHVGVGWKEIFKNWLQLKRPVLGASNEWLAIKKLGPSVINVMEALVFGERGVSPANQESFLITRELKDTISLETLSKTWKGTPPSYQLKKALIENVALIARTMKEQGFNHCDFYICHILMDISSGLENIDAVSLKLFLVDLHRMQMRDQVPERWLVKDIGSLYFSAMNIGLTLRDFVRFMRCYEGGDVRAMMGNDFWKKVSKRATKLYVREWNSEPGFPK